MGSRIQLGGTRWPLLTPCPLPYDVFGAWGTPASCELQVDGAVTHSEAREKLGGSAPYDYGLLDLKGTFIYP